MKDNIYTPPTFRTVTPPIDHRRELPNYTQITDEHRKRFFTRFDENLLKSIRQFKNN